MCFKNTVYKKIFHYDTIEYKSVMFLKIPNFFYCFSSLGYTAFWVIAQFQEMSLTYFTNRTRPGELLRHCSVAAPVLRHCSGAPLLRFR